MIKKYNGRLSALTLVRIPRHHSRRNSVECHRMLPPLSSCRASHSLIDVASIMSEISPPTCVCEEPKLLRDLDLSVIETVDPIEFDTDEAFMEAFNRQLEICRYIFDVESSDFSDPRKKAQVDALGRILKVYSEVESYRKLSLSDHKNVLDVIEMHISHCFPPFDLRIFCGEEKLSVNFADFRSLEFIYRILALMYPVASARPVFGVNWHRKLIPALNSPDSRERDAVVKCLVQFYVNFETMRDDLIERLCELMASVLYGDATPYCVRPALCVLLRILSNMSGEIPKHWLELICQKVLPVFRSPYLTSFVVIYRKILEIVLPTDRNLPANSFWYFWKYFPRGLFVNQSYVVDFMNLALAQMNVTEFVQNAPKIGMIYRSCILSDNMRVTEAAMRIWLEPKILSRLENKKKVLIPLMRSAVSRVERWHWNSTTQQIALKVLEVMKVLDPMAYQDDGCRNLQHQEEQSMVKWLFVMRTAVSINRDSEIGAKMEPVIREAFRRKPCVPMLKPRANGLELRKKMAIRSESRLSVPKVVPPCLLPEVVCK